MKKTLFLAMGLFSVYTSLAQTEIINIPDVNFKNALLTYNPTIDTNNDGEIQQTEAQAVEVLDVAEKYITDLSGIEHFTNLKDLNCRLNQLTSLDVSQNTALEKIICSENQLTSLDITQNIALKDFKCKLNQLTSLDITQNLALEELDCSKNQLTNLDISQNTALKKIICSENPLMNLDITQNTALETLECLDNQLTNLDVSQNLVLGGLACGWNQLTSLDVTQNIELAFLLCDNNPLSSLNLANGNNGNIILMVADDCPNLSCIQIDEGFTPNGWLKDATASYSTDCSSAGIAEIYTLRATIFPNPTTNILYLEAEQPITATTVYDLSGKEIFSTKETQSVDVSELPNGVYFIEINTNKAKAIKKFVKK